MEVQIVLRYWNVQLRGGPHFILRRDLGQIEVLASAVEMIPQHPIQRFAVVWAVIVSFVEIDVVAELVSGVEQLENRQRSLNQRRQRIAGAEAAGVPGVVAK